MKAVAVLVVVAALLLAGCKSASPEQIPEGMQCASDSDCAVGGCSGELCGAKGEVEEVMTACVYQQSYQCLKLTSCGCVNGLCQWDRNSKYNKCVEENS
ncbi:MAG: eight-cysteine-cluster domain-containing protein [Candidatus Woesearchaeota archaeon]